MNESEPSTAFFTPPDTGASTSAMPRSASAQPSSRVLAGEGRGRLAFGLRAEARHGLRIRVRHRELEARAREIADHGRTHLAEADEADAFGR